MNQKIEEIREQIGREKSVDKQILLCRNLLKLLMAKRESEFKKI